MPLSSSPSSSRTPSIFKEWNVDWMMVFLALSLVFSGLLAIYSSEGVGLHHTDHLFRQCCAFAIGAALAFGLVVVPYQVFQSYYWWSYLFSALCLVFVLFTGTVFRGTKGWFMFGPFRLQASEVARPLFLLSFASYLDRKIQWENFRALVPPLAIMCVPTGLLLLQPDLSGAIVYVPIVVGMLYLCGARALHLISLGVMTAIILGVPLTSTYLELAMENDSLTSWQKLVGSVLSGGWQTLAALAAVSFVILSVAWFLKKMKIQMPRFLLASALGTVFLGAAGAAIVQHHIKNYQRERLVTFVSPSIDPLGSGYQVRQSKIAIGSGRVLGKGFTQATQVRLGFLPAFHTDFIFSVIAEEFGFLGALIVMGFYLLLVWRGFDIAANARDKFGSLMASGIAIMFAFYGFINIGMTLGLTPVVGIPLPLVSYGGSGLVSHLFAVGLLMSIHRHRYVL